MKKFKLVTLLGIRPDFIRMHKLIKLIDESGLIDHFFLHSGQHFDYEMDEIFFKELNVRQPDLNFEIGKTLKEKEKKTNHAYQTALLSEKISDFLEEYKPDALMYLGDTNTVVSSIIVAKHNIPIIHIEGGGRSFDWRMPEEKNRIVIDHLSDLLYVYLERYKEILLSEGISDFRIKVVGNIIVDAIKEFLPKAQEKSNILNDLNIKEKEFILCTLHREENIENKEILKNKLENLIKISEYTKKPIVIPVMPRTDNSIKKFNFGNLINNKDFIITKPLGFLDFLKLEKNAYLTVTDSGTVQEESCLLGVPCVVARRSTERPETIKAGASVLEGVESEKSLFEKARQAINLPSNWDRNILNPTGKSPSETIFNDLTERIKGNYFQKSRKLEFLKNNRFVRQSYNL
ncbi:MAG: UDP-N-acetylglucosamine 2-epimerase (non-hydrolyzing) [Candidatus Pacebacteria bacterium]|nr:UDP-N-acetylglucosamine 2-epimerase (non-hydrolyzing) [Candidatus Paceibacterota bacterium]